MNPPTIQTDNLSPRMVKLRTNDPSNLVLRVTETVMAQQMDRSMPATAVPPSSPSTGIPRLPSQNFDSPSLDISISTILGNASTSEPAIAQQVDKVKQLSQENSELEQRLREIEKRLKDVEEKDRKRKSLQPAAATNVITVTTPLAPTPRLVYLSSIGTLLHQLDLAPHSIKRATRARHLTTTLLLLSNTPSCSIMSKFNSRQASRRGSRRASIDPLRLIPMDKLGVPRLVGESATNKHRAKAPAAGEDFNVVFIGAGNIMFGSPEGPWNHSFRFEHKLGPRLKVVALIDPALDRASAVLQKKRDSFVVSAYQNTKMYKTIDDFAKSMTPEEKPRAIIVGSPPHWRGSDLPGKPVSTGPHTTALDISRRITEAGNVCSVGYMLRYLKAVQMMKQIIEDKELVVMATSARYVCAYEPIAKPDWWDKSRDQGPIVEQGTHFCDLSRYFGGDVDISSVMAHSVEWDEEPGQLSKIPIDENKIAPENRIPRVTTATWKYENGAVGTLTHAVALHGTNYSCELEVYLDGYQMRQARRSLSYPNPLHPPPLVTITRRLIDSVMMTHSFQRQVSNLIDVIEHGEGTAEILSTYEDACKTYEFTWAIRLANAVVCPRIRESHKLRVWLLAAALPNADHDFSSTITDYTTEETHFAKPFRLSLVQLGGTGDDKAANLEHAKEMVLKAAQPVDGKKTNLIVLPECFNSPYGHMHFPNYAETIGYKPGEAYDVSASKSESVKALSTMAKETGIWLLGGSIPERDEVDDPPKGELVAIHRKVHLFDIDIPGGITFKESETLTGGTKLTSFETEFGKIGLGICYDVRFPEMAMIAARKGCVAMLYPGAFNLTTGPLHWELLQRARAVDNQIYVAMCSPARDMSAGYHAWGHSMVVDPMGKVIATTEHEEAIIHADIDPEVIRKTRSGIPVTIQRRFDVYPDVSI
ncbi:putative oxidoreductase C terminal [Rhizoctonia solani]|uniref:Putative oxidoreductase C terminal n=1 Tax=Rhizoctonia solani TaxID=456999 RepID=A0A8H7IKC0_9AGAM|nr:putative oxidoreductase C terminal [Rhizoctonia solani]